MNKLFQKCEWVAWLHSQKHVHIFEDPQCHNNEYMITKISYHYKTRYIIIIVSCFSFFRHRNLSKKKIIIDSHADCLHTRQFIPTVHAEGRGREVFPVAQVMYKAHCNFSLLVRQASSEHDVHGGPRAASIHYSFQYHSSNWHAISTKISSSKFLTHLRCLRAAAKFIVREQ